MYRCLALAKQGLGKVAPNPMVGAVLVFENKVIGEGYHQTYGQSHAEVNCLASVREEDASLVAASTLYVSLEPCAHFGKTPPCVDTIIAHRIPRVVVGCSDPFKEVNGKGIGKLIDAGIEVVQRILEKECRELNRRFFLFHTLKRPYVFLKWAQSADKKIGADEGHRLLISNTYSNRLVHKWRGSEAAIMVGTTTALSDNPQLTTRLWPGKNPLRIVLDLKLRLPASLSLFNDEAVTIVFNLQKHTLPGETSPDKIEKGLYYYKLGDDAGSITQILKVLHELQIQSILVEGGAKLLQSFIDEGCWDEARIITNEELHMGEGVSAPALKNADLTHTKKIVSDVHTRFKNNYREQPLS
jgi:diaminohydroxyphosphoribosylaminopyrimidine deaminase/5-amino-6-(5-phosphoribosylamino)uracil reductase